MIGGAHLARISQRVTAPRARWLALALVLASPTTLLATPGTATTDTIYLTSGRVIHTGSTRVADGHVHFSQFGGTVSIPLEQVERIVEDANVERATAPMVPDVHNVPAAPAAPSAPMVPTSETTPGTSATATASTPANATPSQPWDQPEYWISRIKEVDQRIARVQSELDRLPNYDDVEQRMFRFSGQVMHFVAERKKWEGFLRQLQLSRRQLLEGARKAGIAPGALRQGLSN